MVKRRDVRRSGYLRLPKTRPGFGQWLKKYIEKQDITIIQAATRLGVGPRSFANWCDNNYMPCLADWIALRERIRETSNKCEPCGSTVFINDCPCLTREEEEVVEGPVPVAIIAPDDGVANPTKPNSANPPLGIDPISSGEAISPDNALLNALVEVANQLKRVNDSLDKALAVPGRSLPAKRVKKDLLPWTT